MERTGDFNVEGRQKPVPLHKFRQYPLVLDQYAKSIEQFENVRELMQVWRDTLQGKYKIPSLFLLRSGSFSSLYHT